MPVVLGSALTAFGEFDPVGRPGTDRKVLSDPAARNNMATQAKLARR